MKLSWSETLKGARRALVERLRRVAPSNGVALILFALVALIVIRLWSRVSLAPGQDYHFHLMAAAMHARPSGNTLRELFHPLHPLDANTLVYRVAWPFVRLFGPVRGFEITVGLLYYLGFPSAVWYALRRSGRAPWGALLAFVFVYCRAWSLDGFVPFLCSSTLMVLCLGEWDALLALRDAKLRWTVARAAVFSSLLFVCHAHTFGWIAATLGVITALSVIRRLVAGDAAVPLRENARDAGRASLGSLLAILPALALVYLWTQRIETYAPPLPPDPPSIVPPPTMELVMINRVQAFHIYFLQLVEPREVKSAVALAMLCVGLLFFAQRDDKRTLTFELFSLASLVSFFVLPNDVRGQSIAPRHLEFFAWSLPLVLWPAPDPAKFTPRERQQWPWLREGLLLSAMMVFVVGRLRTIETAVADLNRIELEPVLALAEPCRRAKSSSRAVLAYVPMDKESRYVRSWAMQQVHEALAAVCEIDAPVYDSHRRFHHVVPLRYRGPLPAPLSLYEGAAYWYLPTSGLWDHYEFVLTQGWEPTPEAQVELDRVATLVGRSGAYRLYHRRPR